MFARHVPPDLEIGAANIHTTSAISKSVSCLLAMPQWTPPPPPQRILSPGTAGLRSGSVKANCAKIAGKLQENCGKAAETLRCRTQTPRSLKEQHVCTGDTQGTNTHARGSNCGEIAENSGKLRKIADLIPPPPPPAFPVNSVQASAVGQRQQAVQTCQWCPAGGRLSVRNRPPATCRRVLFAPVAAELVGSGRIHRTTQEGPASVRRGGRPSDAGGTPIAFTLTLKSDCSRSISALASMGRALLASSSNICASLASSNSENQESSMDLEGGCQRVGDAVRRIRLRRRGPRGAACGVVCGVRRARVLGRSVAHRRGSRAHGHRRPEHPRRRRRPRATDTSTGGRTWGAKEHHNDDLHGSRTVEPVTRGGGGECLGRKFRAKILLPLARHLEVGRGTTMLENCISRLCPSPLGSPPPPAPNRVKNT